MNARTTGSETGNDDPPTRVQPTRQRKVVLLEQSQLSRAFLSRLFAKLDFQCTEAGSRDDALGLILGGRPDLVCMSAWLGEISAIEFVTELRAGNYAAPILLMTARGGQAFREQARRAGVTGVVEKRAGDELASRITEFIRHHVDLAPHRGRVLYVEDSRTEAVWMRAQLDAMGLEIDHYTNAEDALARLEEGPKNESNYDLIITDVLLKGRQSGVDLIARVREMAEPRSRTPILTVTGFDEAPRRIELLRAGTTDYVVKPVLADELIVRVNNLISNKQLLDRVIQQQTQLREMAMTDQLTGCQNRRGLLDHVRRHIARRARRRSAESDAFLLLDLDHFKQLNDTHGHEQGDRVLEAVGECLLEFSRESDVVCRTGGEEFVLYLPDCEHDQVRNVAERLRRSIRRLQPGGHEVTASIGATSVELTDLDDFDRALRNADEALYRAKGRGRDRVAVQKTPR